MVSRGFKLILGIRDLSVGLIPNSVKTDAWLGDDEWECGIIFVDRISGGYMVLLSGPKLDIGHDLGHHVAQLLLLR